MEKLQTEKGPSRPENPTHNLLGVRRWRQPLHWRDSGNIGKRKAVTYDRRHESKRHNNQKENTQPSLLRKWHLRHLNSSSGLQIIPSDWRERRGATHSTP